MANNPCKTYNPLFIYGGVGLGKTHLLNAVGHHILKKNGDLKIHFLSSETFTNELINSIRYQKMSVFRKKFRDVDVLLLDDVHFFSKKDRTQEEFFHTFNTLYESHKQIMVTSDKFPKDITGLEEKLRSRFEWGLIVDIKPPELETRIAILESKAILNNISIPKDVLFFLASNIKSNIRELEGMLNRIVAFSSLTGNKISLALAKEILKDLIKKEDITIDLIQRKVADCFNIKVYDLKSNKKMRVFALPRQIGMYLTRQLTELSFPEIGLGFGGKDHSTVIYAVKKIKNDIETDGYVKDKVDFLMETIE